MNEPKGCAMVAVVEDKCHQKFAMGVLRQLGFTPRNIRVEMAPKGKGSANAIVRSRFVPEVRAFRKRRGGIRPNSGILVVLDADQYTVEQRVRALDQALMAAQLAPRGDA